MVEDKSPHQHYWLLDEPNGQFAKGICINNTKHEIIGCGEVRDFPNSHETSTWATKSRMLEASQRGASMGGKAKALKERHG
ncbi:hypothetical protein [uncultured Mediterranean phage uvDeep-CGR0-AD1-C239]|nr:hypothetical protein [uncultured Mediterranean phage uvDeep-CGR0-AD1-C239]